MKWTWKLMPLLAALLLLAMVLTYGPTLAGRAAYAVAAGEARAAREQLPQLSKHDQLSALFRTVSKVVKPAVVVVHVKQKVTVRPMPDADDLFRRFFGDRMPNMPRRSPTPPREYFARGLGSGVIVDAKNGYVLTNWHVVRNADKVEIALPDNRRMTAEWVRTDAATDLAIVKVKPDRLIDAPLGDSDKAAVGDWVLAIGAPEGLPQTVTAGIISAKGRYSGGTAYQDFIQTDAAINHGNSGGPLVNMRGEVIGINSAIISRTGVNEGIGLTVPSNMAKVIMRQLIEKGKVTRGYLGVVIQNIDEELARSLKLPGMEGTLVAQVAEGGPAEKAGIREEDFLTAVNGKKVRNVNELRNAVADLTAGKSYPFELIRNGKKMTIKVKITTQPGDMEAAFGQDDPGGGGQAERFGLTVEKMTDELARKYGYRRAPEGVVISEVKPGSDAAERGLTAGMVILKVQGKKVTTPSDFARLASGRDARDGIRLQITNPTGTRRYVFVAPSK